MFIELTCIYTDNHTLKELINIDCILSMRNILDEIGCPPIEELKQHFENMIERSGKAVAKLVNGEHLCFAETREEIQALIRKERTNQWGH